MRFKFRGLRTPRYGQIWIHKKTKTPIIITENGDHMLRCVNVCNRKVQHHIKKTIVWIYYEYLGTEKTVDVDNLCLTIK